MSKPNLRAVDPTQDHPRDIARRRVKEHQQRQKDPITNIHVPEEVRPALLSVDEVVNKSDPTYLVGKK